MIDKEEVIKSLEYFTKNRICLPHLIPWDDINAAIRLLKEQEIDIILLSKFVELKGYDSESIIGKLN